MTTTGWTGEAPEAEAPALPVAEMLLRNRERGPGDTLAIAQARGSALEARELREAAAAAVDPDERAASLVNRGYTPGLAHDLGQRLADKSAELQAEWEKIARGERVAARVRRMLERGQIGGLEAARMMDGDFGDAARAEQLERQCERLGRQVREAQAMIAPPQERQLDGVAEAGRHAHATFVEVTRQRFADAQAGRPASRRPFGSISRGAVPGEVTCGECLALGATPEESFLIHNDPDPVPVPDGMQQAERTADTSWSAYTARANPSGGEVVRTTEGAFRGIR